MQAQPPSLNPGRRCTERASACNGACVCRSEDSACDDDGVCVCRSDDSACNDDDDDDDDDVCVCVCRPEDSCRSCSPLHCRFWASNWDCQAGAFTC